MGSTGKALKGCLLAAGILLLSLLVVLGLYIGWSLYADDRAEKAATALCAGIHGGDRIEAVVAKAKATVPTPRVASGTDEHHFIFQGAVFHARECQVSTARGRVTAAHVVVFDD